MKKAQISYFILIAIILLITFSFIFYLNSLSYEKDDYEVQVASASFEPIRNFIDECVKISAQQSILSNGLQGGFYNETSNSLFNSFFVIPIYSNNSVKLVPSLEKLEEQLAYSLNDNIVKCVNDFEFAEKKGFQVVYRKPISEAKILENQVYFKLNFPIDISSNGKFIKSFNGFAVSIDSRYKLAYKIADKIAELQTNEPNKLCMSCLIGYGIDNDVAISVTDYDKNNIVFAIIDNKIKVGNEDFVFMFAHSKGENVA